MENKGVIIGSAIVIALAAVAGWFGGGKKQEQEEQPKPEPEEEKPEKKGWGWFKKGEKK